MSAQRLIVCIALLLLVGFFPYFYSIAKSRVHADMRFAQGTMVGGIDAGKMTEEQLRDALERYQTTITEHGITAVVDGTVVLVRDPVSLDPDIPIRQDGMIVRIDYDATIRNAFFIHNQHSPIGALLATARISPKKNIPISLLIDESLFRRSLESAFPNAQRPTQEADIVFQNKQETFEVVSERAGTLFDSARAVQSLRRSLEWGDAPTLTVGTIEQEPTITSSDAEQLIPDATALVRPITIRVDSTTFWALEKERVAQWLTVGTSAEGSAVITTRTESIASYLEKTIAPSVFMESKDPRFEIKKGKIIISTVPQTGKKLDIDENVARISHALLSGSDEDIALSISEYKPAELVIPSQESIKEIVARAQTDFKGSPKNRRMNIAHGMARINGVLVQPDEEFSLLQYLSPIDDRNGFLPELVIKGNVTKPEYGGGLCQVSTTLFRAVAYAGLPVTARRNHSYRVSYYEPPAGFDATIYSPAPDFKFKNDMATPILIQAEVKGTKAIVTFWGTEDGRISEVDKPTVYNIKKPPATKIIETTELKSGEKKCTEKAHSGADAFFERRVTYPSGEVKKETFKSHYIVWPAVCYVGIDKPETTPQPDPIPILN